MTDGLLSPATESELAGILRRATAGGEPLAIEGNGTKRALLRPVQAARTLTVRHLTGITLYRPQELILSARAGTPLPEIEAALAEKGQYLIAEPPDTTALFEAEAAETRPATIGGVVACNLSGPRRISAGAMRDHVMGVRLVNGQGEVVHSGGRVLKNVTGLDLCKLLTGSYGTLGVLTEVTLKVLPAPPDSATVAVSVRDLAAGVRVLSAGLGSPFGPSGAALLPGGAPELGLQGPTALLRLEDFSDSVRYRAESLAARLGREGDVTLLEAARSVPLWRAVRDAAPLGALPEEAIWRVSVRPSAAPGVAASLSRAFDAKLLLDWGGGLLWIAGPAEAATHAAVMAAARAAGGTWTLFRGPDGLRASSEVLPPEPAPLAAISARVKAALDPRGVLNPGRMHAGL
ncbi:glycolate oxidase subunit GlcE [Roseomonas sp. NAR14]|uniref:Glycolate oxidase subunit GlcE n=1 Tax=Roseomonas acroporae TaxID=2937791 RepID=A0A9X2BTS4_9PROT|nr:glycolate oxidase subunit GlcE [Roseomonas acroporae]MCK8784632.1 glycolate oxidase subunit GlcE [Roseomonas acroporae]